MPAAFIRSSTAPAHRALDRANGFKCSGAKAATDDNSPKWAKTIFGEIIVASSKGEALRTYLYRTVGLARPPKIYGISK